MLATKAPRRETPTGYTRPVKVGRPKKGKDTGKPKAKATKPKGAKKVASHPTSASMVIEAITKLNEKGGSSLQAIKKYIADVHKVDTQKQGIHIRRALVKAVETGKLTQPKGKGAAGSFKLTIKPKPAKNPSGDKKAPSPKKPKVTKSPKKPTGVNKAKAPKPTPAKAKAPNVKLSKPVKARKVEKKTAA